MTVLSWGVIKEWTPGPLDTAEGHLKGHVDKLMSHGDTVATQGAPALWEGDAASAARTARDCLVTAAASLGGEFHTGMRAVAQAQGGLSTVRSAVLEASSFAAANELRIADDGSVSDSMPSQMFPTQAEADAFTGQRNSVVAACARLVQQATQQAMDVDAQLATQLVGLGASQNSPAGGSSTGQELPEPPTGAGTAADNAAWWKGLAKEQQEQIIKEHPDWIGNRDGVSFAARDRANRALLPIYKQQLEDERKKLAVERAQDDPLAGWAPNSATDAQNLAKLTEVSEQLAAVEEALRLAALPDHHVIGFDLSHPRAQSIIAQGNLHDAERVAVFTPGMASTVQGYGKNETNMGKYDTDMYNMRKRVAQNLRQKDPSLTMPEALKKVATVTWLDYQSPQWNTIPSSNSVAAPFEAKKGGRNLAEFYRGIHSARTHQADVTALGHSYGSTITGYAMREDTGVNRAVYFGSPGIGVSDLKDQKVPAGNSYYAEAEWDGVGDLATFGADPSWISSMQHLETQERTTSDGQHLDGVTLHMRYLNDRTTSQYNIAKVIAGQTGDIIHGNDRGVGDILSNPWRPWDWFSND